MITDNDVNNFYKKLFSCIANSESVAYRNVDEIHHYPELFSNMLKINSALTPFGNESIVLYTDKRFSTYSAIFSVILSGNTWVPLSLEMTHARNLDIIKLVNPKLILHNVELPEILRDYLKENNIDCLSLDEIIESNNTKEFPDFNYCKDDIAYIMFTSGSTGIPKGVPMTHENYINFINNAMEIFPFEKNEVFSDFHDFAFDISIFYIFCCPLTEGAFAPVINETDKMIPLRFIQDNKITVWSSVPSSISRIQMLNPNKTIQTYIKIMFLCGEPFSLRVLEYCTKNMGVKNTYNFYGLTETGVENFYHKCSPEDLVTYESFGFVPIGKPLNGNKIRVTDDKELLISGCQITPGYLQGVGQDKFEMIDGVRWFHSGDIVELHDGVCFCKGRMDSQVKIKSYRIELMDIEVHMKRFSGVSEAICFVEEKKNKKVLLSVVKPKQEAEIDLSGLKEFVAQHLPHYMVPKKIFILQDIPVNNNGKIDRRRIKEMFEGK